MSQLASLIQLIDPLEHVAQVQYYLQHFIKAFQEGAITAIPGKEITFKRGKYTLRMPSFTVLSDKEFTTWHERIITECHTLQPHTNKIASPELYADMTPEMFAYLAQQSRQNAQLPLEVVVSANKEKVKAATPPRSPKTPAAEATATPKQQPAPQAAVTSETAIAQADVNSAP